MKLDLETFLTPKQQRFCSEYLADMNATRAALAAGYSRSTAMNGQLMTMPKILLYLQQKTADRVAKADITADMVMRELGKIAFGNMGNYFDAEGRMKPMHEVSDDDKAALWSVSLPDRQAGVNDADSETADGAVTKVRMYNKLSALDKLAKCMNLYKKEPKAPEVMYAYLHKCHMDADDRFDDEELVKDIEREQMAEDGGQMEEEEVEQMAEGGGQTDDEEDVEYYTDEELDLSGEAKDVFYDENDKARAEILRMTEMEKLFKMVFYDGEWRTPTVVRLMEESKTASPPAP